MGASSPPDTFFAWRSGARVPGHAGPIVAKVPGSAHKKKKSKEKKDKAKREDIKGYTNIGGAAEGCATYVCGTAEGRAQTVTIVHDEAERDEHEISAMDSRGATI